MVQLNDLINVYPFKCQKCEAELTSEWLVAAAVTYGAALIAGEKDGWIGWSCPGPDCGGRTSNFTRLEKAAFNQVINEIREAAESAMLGRFCYHSFPDPYPLKEGDSFFAASTVPNGEFDSACLSEFTRTKIDEVIESLMKTDEVRNGLVDFKPEELYCSYILGTDANGPKATVWWYQNGHVENLIERENQTGLKLFPRYIVHNPLYSTIDAFCWHNRLHFEYLKEANLPFDVKEIFLCTEKKKMDLLRLS